MVLLLLGYHETVLIRLADESDADGALNIRHTPFPPQSVLRLVLRFTSTRLSTDCGGKWYDVY